MAENVKRVVVGDVYSWMTPIEGVPGRWHHNTAGRGEEIEVSAAEAKRGEGLGFLADPDDVPEVDPDDEGLAIVVTSDGVEHVGELPAAAARPAQAANKDAWVDFAVSQGADRDEAEAKTKAELIDAYGA